MSDAFYSLPVPNLKQTLVESPIQSSKITKIYDNNGSFKNLYVSYFLILCSNIRYKIFFTNLNCNRKTTDSVLEFGLFIHKLSVFVSVFNM